MQGNILLVSGFPAILPSQVILPSGDVIAVSSVAVVRIQYNKTILPLCKGNMTFCSSSAVNVIQVKLPTAGEQMIILPRTRAVII